MAILSSQLFTGVSLGAILLLVAMGLTFTFGQMGVINMAHGEFIMAGAYTAYLLQDIITNPTYSMLIALPLAFVVAGLMGVILEMTLLSRLRGRALDTLLVTWGVALVLQQLARDLFGAPNVQVVAPEFLTGGLTIGDITLPWSRIAIFLLVIGVLAVVSLMVSQTSTGRQMRAVVQNRDLADISGINTSRVDRRTFFIGSGLAGIAGVALTLLGSIGPTLGTAYVIDAFLVVVVGGLGSLRGAVIAAFALGMLNSFLEFWTNASLAKVLVFAAIIAFLQVRPQGLVVLRSRSLA